MAVKGALPRSDATPALTSGITNFCRTIEAGQPAAGELAAVLRGAVAAVRAGDHPEQAWDSYVHEGCHQEQWSVLAPLAGLTAAREPGVAVPAAELLVGGEDSAAGYRRAWTHDKRLLELVSAIAARFPEQGGEPLARAVRRRLPRLNAADRAAVELHLATDGLSGGEPTNLARDVLAAAERDELGSRGELVRHVVRRWPDLPPAAAVSLAPRLLAVARQTPPFVASQPLAEAIEAWPPGVGELDDVAELLARATELRRHDWPGWDRTLAAARSGLRQLASRDGVALLRPARAAAREFGWDLPHLDALVHLGLAEGLPSPDGARLAHEALAAARALPPTVESATIEADAARRLLALGAEGGPAELRLSLERLAAASLPHRGALLTPLLTALAAVGEADDLPLAARLVDRIHDSSARWLAAVALASAPAATPEFAARQRDVARLAARRWFRRRPPFDAMVPIWAVWAARLPTGPRHPAAQRLAVLLADVARHRVAAWAFAREFVALGELFPGPTAAPALLSTLQRLPDSWWRLPLLALLGDSLGRWATAMAAADRPPPETP